MKLQKIMEMRLVITVQMIVTALFYLTAVGGIGLTLAILNYVSYSSGHTGADPYSALYIYLPLAIMGGVGWILFREMGHIKRASTCCLLTGIFGVAMLLYFDYSNTLLQYDVWIERGMP